MVELLTKLPRQLITLAREIIKDIAGGEAYLVGGAVRDIIMGRATKDYDIVVRGLPAEALEARLAKLGQVSLVGKTFGVFKWQPDGWTGEAIDVALPRTEHVTSGTGQYRDFAVQSNAELPIEEDLARRDFTVNALAVNLATGGLIDPSGGQVDLKSKTLRTVGEPAVRFSEDLSRTLRGLRFACQLGFELEKQTWAAIQTHAERTATGTAGDGTCLVPREIVAREVLKALIANPPRALELLDESGFLSHLLPEVVAMKNCPQAPEFHSEGDVFKHTKLALEALSGEAWHKFFGDSKPSLNAIAATLLHDIGKPLTIKTPEIHGTNRIRTDGHDAVGAELVPQICERLKLTSYVDLVAGQIETETVRWLVEHHLLLLNDPKVLKPSTIYRYFLKNRKRGLELEQLIFADSWASLPPSKKPTANRLKSLRERLPEITAKLSHGKLKLLLSGTDIMKALKLPPGPKIGELLRALEEAQLEGHITSRRQALDLLKTSDQMNSLDSV